MIVIRRIEVEIRHKIFLGGFEVIEPCVRLCADLDPGDDLDEARKVVAKEVHALWAREVIEELRLVNKRRGHEPPPSNDKLPGLMTAFKDIVKAT